MNKKWYVKKVMNQFYVEERGGMICEILVPPKQALEVAKLIAAAPDLLKRFELIQGRLQGYSKWKASTDQEAELITAIQYSLNDAMEAIRQVTGRIDL